MKYAVETTSKSKIGIDIMALKLSKKSYLTKQPTPVTDMKSKLNGDVKRKKLRKLFVYKTIVILRIYQFLKQEQNHLVSKSYYQTNLIMILLVV